jgi:hypothetical protein
MEERGKRSEQKAPRPRISRQTKATKISLTFPQAKEIVEYCYFVDHLGNADKGRNEMLYNLLVADKGTELKVVNRHNYFTVAWQCTLKNGIRRDFKIIWRYGEHNANKAVKNLIVAFLDCDSFYKFKKRAIQFLGKAWKEQFSKPFDPTTSTTQKKGKIKIQGVEGSFATKRANGEYKIFINHTYIGNVTQQVAAHIWKFPEYYFMTCPQDVEELNVIYRIRNQNKKA